MGGKPDLLSRNTFKPLRTNSPTKAFSFARFLCLLALLAGAATFILSACIFQPGDQESHVDESQDPPGVPEKLVSLSPAHTEILFALGLGDKVVGVSNWCNKPEEALQKEKVGDAYNLNKEKLVALEPDLVFVPGDEASQLVKEIEDLGIAVHASNPVSVSQVLDDIRQVARLAGVEGQGEGLATNMEEELNALFRQLEASDDSQPVVFVVIDEDLWTVGPGSFVDDVLKRAGGENMVKDLDMPYLQVSMEEIMVKEPDIILITIPEEFAGGLVARPGWQDLRAVKEGKVYYVDGDLVSRPGPSIVDGVKEVARYFYPSLILSDGGTSS